MDGGSKSGELEEGHLIGINATNTPMKSRVRLLIATIFIISMDVLYMLEIGVLLLDVDCMRNGFGVVVVLF